MNISFLPDDYHIKDAIKYIYIKTNTLYIYIYIYIYKKREREIHFLCLMVYQPSWVI